LFWYIKGMSDLLKQLKSLALSDIALPSNIGYGTAIYDRGAVELIKLQDDFVEAWAGGLSGTVKEGGGTRRRVQLWLEDGELRWHCTGNPKHHDIFCKHCVATVLFVANATS
jgi:uncharacterized Zn finger protein